MWRCLRWVLYKMHIFWVLILYKSSKSSTTQPKIVWSEAVALRCSAKKGVLRNFVKFSGKQLYQSLFFNKVADIRPATLLKKRLWHRCFPVSFAKFLKTLFLQNTSGGCLCAQFYHVHSSIVFNFQCTYQELKHTEAVTRGVL